MPIFFWDPKFSVHIALIDEQHQKLIDTANLLYDAIIQGRSADVLDEIFIRMADYVSVHFATEEKLMLEYQFPGYDEHKKEHTDCTHKIADFKEQLAQGQQRISIDLISFLISWIHHHLLYMDAKYCDFFKEKGVT
jgi:hemerythrin